MPRKLALVILLVLSHGLALWLGMQRQTLAASASAGEEGASAPASSSTRQDEAAELQAKLRGYIERGAAADQAEAAKATTEEELDDDTRFAQLRARLAADPGFDPESTLKTATVNLNAEYSPETIAAFGVWLDREPLKALRWFGNVAVDCDCEGFQEELARYLKRSGFGQLKEMMAEVGIGRHLMLSSVHLALDELGDPAEIMKAAGSMQNTVERVELFTSVLDSPEDLAGNLAAIRACFDDADATLFLSKIWDKKGALALLDEVRTAGFPAEAVRSFEEVAKEEAGPKGFELSDLAWSAPDSVFSQELWLGEIGPQEYYEQLRAQAPPGSAAQLFQAVFDGMMQVDPLAGMAWAQKAVPDWGSLFAHHMAQKSQPVLTPEVQVMIAAQAWADGLPEDQAALTKIQEGFSGAYVDDPEAWQAVMEKLPAGPLREALEKHARESNQEEEEGP